MGDRLCFLHRTSPAAVIPQGQQGEAGKQQPGGGIGHKTLKVAALSGEWQATPSRG